MMNSDSNNAEQRSLEWHKQRRGRVTASIVGAILGVSPFMTKQDALRMMVRQYHNAQSEFNGNVATEWGNFNEAGAIYEFEMEFGVKVDKAYFVPYGDYLGCSPDGFVSDGKLIEVKAPYGLRKGGEFKSIYQQMHYYSQIQMQLLCTNKQECWFYQWQPSKTMAEIVRRDEDFIEKMLYECEVFYNDYLIEREFPNATKYINNKI